MLIFYQGVSSTKAKKGDSAYLKNSEQNPVSVKKNHQLVLIHVLNHRRYTGQVTPGIRTMRVVE